MLISIREPDQEKTLDMGAIAFFGKPIPGRKLIETVNRVLAK